MARGARRPKSAYRASLEPLHDLNISWRPGRSGMGTLVDIQRGCGLLQPSLSLHGLDVMAIASRLFQEGDPHGFDETVAALALLARRGHQQGLLAALWYMLDVAGWLGNLSHCWNCGRETEDTMFWQRGLLVCDSCGTGMRVSAGLRKSIAGITSGGHVRLGEADADTLRKIIRLVLQEHGIKATAIFEN